MALGDRRLDLIKRFPDAVKVTGPETIADLSKEWFKLRDDELKLASKYYKEGGEADPAADRGAVDPDRVPRGDADRPAARQPDPLIEPVPR